MSVNVKFSGPMPATFETKESAADFAVKGTEVMERGFAMTLHGYTASRAAWEDENEGSSYGFGVWFREYTGLSAKYVELLGRASQVEFPTAVGFLTSHQAHAFLDAPAPVKTALSQQPELPSAKQIRSMSAGYKANPSAGFPWNVDVGECPPPTKVKDTLKYDYIEEINSALDSVLFHADAEDITASEVRQDLLQKVRSWMDA